MICFDHNIRTEIMSLLLDYTLENEIRLFIIDRDYSIRLELKYKKIISGRGFNYLNII